MFGASSNPAILASVTEELAQSQSVKIMFLSSLNLMNLTSVIKELALSQIVEDQHVPFIFKSNDVCISHRERAYSQSVKNKSLNLNSTGVIKRVSTFVKR